MVSLFILNENLLQGLAKIQVSAPTCREPPQAKTKLRE